MRNVKANNESPDHHIQKLMTLSLHYVWIDRIRRKEKKKITKERKRKDNIFNNCYLEDH